MHSEAAIREGRRRRSRSQLHDPLRPQRSRRVSAGIGAGLHRWNGEHYHELESDLFPRPVWVGCPHKGRSFRDSFLRSVFHFQSREWFSHRCDWRDQIAGVAPLLGYSSLHPGLLPGREGSHRSDFDGSVRGALVPHLSHRRHAFVQAKRVEMHLRDLAVLHDHLAGRAVFRWTDLQVHGRAVGISVRCDSYGDGAGGCVRSQLHFEEAAELAYFGAKILHPTCVQPAKYANIPVRLLNTMDPKAPGTLISNDTEKGKIKAVAAKDNITAIKIKSSRMLLAYGFLRKVFEIFESYQTSIDMICTSEVGVSVTVDNIKHLNEILDDLKKYGTVTVDKDMCIICVVGDLEWENVGFEAKALDAMRDIPVRMISFGGSNYNISFLIRECDKKAALQALSDMLFNS